MNYKLISTLVPDNDESAKWEKSLPDFGGSLWVADVYRREDFNKEYWDWF